MTDAVYASGLRKSFRGQTAVDGLDLAVRKGELVALLGPNGAGKTTTIQLLSTLLEPDGGTALVCGYDVVKSAREVRRRISVTGQFAALDEGLSGLDNLLLFARLHGQSGREARITAERLLQTFGLAEAASRAVSAYSGGMKRRLDIAVAMITRPELIFLDEPTTGLDPQSRLEVWEAIRGLLRGGTAVLLTTQYLEEADRLAGRIAVMDQGKIVACGTPRELKDAVGGKTLTVRMADRKCRLEVDRLLADRHGLAGRWDDDGVQFAIPVRESAAAAAVLHTLVSSEMLPEHFSLSEPSLDEVLLHLTGPRRKEAAG